MTTFLIKCGIVLVVFLIMCGSVLLMLHIFYSKIYTEYKKKTSYISVEDLFTILQLIINNEISIYERNVFATRGEVVSNANFDNYYKDICERICENFTDDFYDKFSNFISKDTMIKTICHMVEVYLTEKIKKYWNLIKEGYGFISVSLFLFSAC